MALIGNSKIRSILPAVACPMEKNLIILTWTNTDQIPILSSVRDKYNIDLRYRTVVGNFLHLPSIR